VVVLGEEEVSAAALLDALVQRGMERILVEGGGGLHWLFAREGLLDAIHVTLTPWLAGGATAPTLLGGAGFPVGRFLRLALEEARQEGDEVFLRYRVAGCGPGGPPAR
jgi:5-amino-6-(5-phosphoribosylamino)uracil reductase